jgi:dTMP kinase
MVWKKKKKRRMSLKIKPPFFITFEGGEGAGKTTLIDRLKQIFESSGYSVVLTREPGGTSFGDAIREMLLHRDKKMALGSKAELFLFLSARAQHVEEVIEPALQQNNIVLCDRYSDSTVAYQGHARGLGMDDVEALCDVATDHLIPDLTFYLDLDPKVGLQRIEKNRAPDLIEDQKIEFHNLVREGFLKIAEHNPERMFVVDASQSQDQVLAQVLAKLADE